jgi:hypothetical protein
MSPQQMTIPDAETRSAPTIPHGILRQFFAGWRRLEEAMDYGPYDYTQERIRGLEMRIVQLEQRLAATSDTTGVPMASPTPHATSAAR